MNNLNPNFNIIKTENWVKATYDERLDVLQSIENQISQEQGRATRIIQPISMANDYQCGYYNSNKPDYIFINEEHLSDRLAASGFNYDVVDTTIHEGRHAYQDDAINGMVSNDQTETELWRKNFEAGVYNSPSSGAGDYRYQPIEADANNFSQGEMEKLHNQIGFDEGYDQYLDNRNYYDELARNEAMAKYGENYEFELANEVEQRYEMIYGISNDSYSKDEEYDYYNGYGY